MTDSETAAQAIIMSNRQVVLVAFRGLDLEEMRRFWSNGHSHPINGSVVLNPRREIVKQDQGDCSFSFDLADLPVSQLDAHDTLWYVVRIYRELPN